MVKTNSRLVAIQTLQQLEKSSLPLPQLFQQICGQYGVAGSDRALAMNLIYGVLRQYQYLDRLIAALCRHPLKKMHPLVRQGLAVGLYQLVFLDRIPESAAVNETVKAIKAAKVPKRLHGFVNGVLRQFIRAQKELPRPQDPDERNHPILNHPHWLTARWAARFGEKEMEIICRQNNRQQPLVLRLNRQLINRDKYLEKCSRAEINAQPCIYAPDGVSLPEYQGQVSSLPGYAENWFQVQGEAAQLATLLLQPFKKGGRYLDGCAGLGGKTSHLLQLISSCAAKLVAVEPEKNRQTLLAESLLPAITANKLELFRGSLQEYEKKHPQRFDGILLDAPCSGTGVIGRQPDIRWRRRPEDINRYASVQQELIHLAAKLIRPGGVLVYATCSLEAEENLQLVTSFLSSAPQFALTDCTEQLPKPAAPLVRKGCFQPRPSDGLDGFFAARLVRAPVDD